MLADMQLQAGTVIGGIELVSSPYVPACINRLMLGRLSIHCSSNSDGSAQSSPMTTTFSIRDTL